MKRVIPLLLSLSLSLSPSSLLAATGSGLEIQHPEMVHVVYSIEPTNINQEAVALLVGEMAANAEVELGERNNGQLHLRVEEHAGRYLLYLDFSRQIYYTVEGQCFSKDGFVWGRYAKDIIDIEQLYEDIEFLFDEFLTDYLNANSAD